jgi:hypothetical protein
VILYRQTIHCTSTWSYSSILVLLVRYCLFVFRVFREFSVKESHFKTAAAFAKISSNFDCRPCVAVVPEKLSVVGSPICDKTVAARPIQLLGTVPVKMLSVILTFALFAVVIRRLYFSPLSKIPGPILAAITSLYYTFHEFCGDRHIFIDGLHRKYGPIVRIGPNYVSISDPAAVKEIYGVGSWDKPRDGWYTHFGAYGEDNMFSAWEGREHLKRKKVISITLIDNRSLVRCIRKLFF